jgi:branched-chain amino acid transport system substrate-binding protein
MIICLATVFVLSLAGSYAEAAEAEPPVLKIGAPLPFTGFVAESAREMQDVFLMYIDQNEGKLGGLPVEVIFEDTETQAEMVVTKVKKLIEHDRVHLLTAGMLAFEGLAMVDTITKAKIAYVGHTGVTADEYSRLKSPYISGVAHNTPSQENMPLGEYAYKKLGYRKIAIMAQDYAWGWQCAGGFHFGFERAGGKIVQKLWSPIGTTDYAPFVTQLRRDVDAIYSVLVGADVPRFVKAYSDYGLKAKIPLLGSEDLVAQDAIRYYGDEAIGIIGITPYTPNLERPALQKFVEAYRKRSGRIPSFWSETSYLAAMAIDRALWRLREEGVPAQELPEVVRNDAARFISAIRAIDLSDAPSSPIRVDDYNFSIRDFYLVELVKKDGKIFDKIIDSFRDVSQFWTLEPEEFLKNPVFSRDFPPVIYK